MRAPKKVIAAMAMATMIGGTVAPAFAAEHKFETLSGSAANGKDPLQRAQEFQGTTGNPDTNILNAQGNIEVDGTFIKNVSSFPAPSKDGRYLQVTMPLVLDYTYNLDNDDMKSGNGQIINESAYVTGTDQGVDNAKVEKQDIKMSFVGLAPITNNENVKYVETTNDKDGDAKAQLPFELVVTRNGAKVGNYSLESIQEHADQIDPIIVQQDATLDLKIGKIGSQKVIKSENIKNGETSVRSSMILKFEYNGK